MSEETLDLSNIISVSILSAATGLGLPNINTAALFSTETPEGWDEGQEFKIYTNPTDVGEDFGTTSAAYKLALAFFSQQPNPLGTNGYLAIIPLVEAETVPAAITRTLNTVYYFGVLVDVEMADDDFAALAEAVQALDKMFFYASSDPADYAPSGLFDDVRTASETHTRCLFYKTATAIDTPRFAAAYAGRALSTDFTGSNTTQTLHMKTLATITPDANIDQTALVACETAGVDIYASFGGQPRLFTSGANGFFDEIYNELWLKFALQVAGFNYLSQTSTKIPQTEPGLEGLKNIYRQVCQQAVSNGFVGPGQWNSPTVFGVPADLIRSISDIGFYVYSQPITQQLQADREDRKAPLIQIAVKTQGAIHRSNVIVNVNL